MILEFRVISFYVPLYWNKNELKKNCSQLRLPSYALIIFIPVPIVLFKSDRYSFATIQIQVYYHNVVRLHLLSFYFLLAQLLREFELTTLELHDWTKLDGVNKKCWRTLTLPFGKVHFLAVVEIWTSVTALCYKGFGSRLNILQVGSMLISNLMTVFAYYVYIFSKILSYTVSRGFFNMVKFSTESLMYLWSFLCLLPPSLFRRFYGNNSWNVIYVV